MPGISFVYDSEKKTERNRNLFLESINSLIHDNNYTSEVLLVNNSYFLACTRYPDYPITTFESDKVWICLEGSVYNKEFTQVNMELNNLLEERYENRSDDKIINWLLNTDGDFIIYVLNKQTSEFVILNDALGRLPIYYYINDSQIIISREVQFILNLMPEIRFDNMAIAQYLLFRYPLGKKTLINNVYRLEPGSLISISNNNSKPKVQTIYCFNFERKTNYKDIDRSVDELIILFSEACKNRANKNNKNILSLSGGRDSRSVAAALYRNKIPFIAATMNDSRKKYTRDMDIAEKVANILNVQWEGYQLGSPKGKDLQTLLRMKNGLNYLSMSFMLQFFEQIKIKHGSKVNYFSGDGGDKVLPYLGSSRKFEDINDLINYIVSTKYVLSINDVATITNIAEHKIIDEIRKNVLLYPEKDLNQKYIHFLIYERAFKWLFEGEDRNRFYFWSVTPFYSISFFSYAMNCSDEIKFHDRLYQKFISELYSPVTKVEYAGSYGSHKTLNKYINYVSRRLKLKKRNKDNKNYQSALNINSNAISCIHDQLNNCTSICSYLSNSQLENILNSNYQFNKTAIDNLLTITSTIDKLHCNGSTLQKYHNLEFT
ncbi:MAG: asparagine synthase-related protein [Nitrososphaeraceae archaeon]